MVNSIKNAKKKSIILHIHGIGGIGKSSLLSFWDKTIDDSVLIDCILLPDLDSQIGHLVRSCKSKGLSFPRFDLLWSIRKRVFDGIEPALDEDRKWLSDAIGLIPVIGNFVDIGSKLIAAGKKLRELLQTEHSELSDWLQKELGGKWDKELVQILWKTPDKATLLSMNAVQSDLNEREFLDTKTLVVLIDNVDTSTVKTHRWNIDGQLSNDAALWQKMLSGVKSCIGVTAGRDVFKDKWCKRVGLRQQELKELDLNERAELFESRSLDDEELRKIVDRICKGHPFLMQLVIDAIQTSNMDRTDLEEIKSKSLDEVRSELWSVFFSRIGQLTCILDRAALLPFFDKEILSITCPQMKTKDWLDFQKLSFVKPRGDGYWSLHDIARELVVAEYDSNIVNTINECKNLLINNYKETNNALYYGLTVSLEEFISEESAIEVLIMTIVMFRLANKSKDILNALEGIRFRSDRLVGHLELTKGNALMEMNRFSEAESHIRNALEIQRNLPNDNQVKQNDVAHTLTSLGILLGNIGRGEAAEQVLLESLEIRRKLATPGDVGSLSNLAMVLGNLGQLYSILERLEDALSTLNEAKEIYTKLTKKGQTVCYPDLAKVLNNLGILQKQMGHFRAADRTFQEALIIRIELASQNPYYKSDLASTLINIGNIKAQYGQFDESLSFLFKALEEYESLKDSSSDPSSYDPEIAMILCNLGQSLAKTGKAEEAKEKLLESEEIYRQLTNIAPEKYEPFLGNVLTNLSMLHLRLKEDYLAYEFSNEFVEIFRKLAKENPFYESNLIHVLIIRGNVLSANNFLDQARDTFHEVIELLNRHSDTDNHRLKFNLSCALNGIATIEIKSSNHSEAVLMLKKVLVIRRDLANAYPIVYSFELAKSLFNIGESYRFLKNIDQAELSYQDCIDVCTLAPITSEITEIAHLTAVQLYNLFIEDKGLTKEESASRVQEVIEQAQQKKMNLEKEK